MSAGLVVHTRAHALLASSRPSPSASTRRARPSVATAAVSDPGSSDGTESAATAGGAASRADVLARIARAKQYKQQQQPQQQQQQQEPPPQQDSFATSPVSASLDTVPVLVQPSATVADPPAAGPQQAPATSTPTATTAAAGDPQATAAPWLQGVLSAKPGLPVIDQNLRPEEFTRQKEDLQRAQGADIISVDKNYKPKVSTWGVFPRPKDISQTFGGGRTIRPGEPLESDEEARERERKTKELLQAYKKQIGAHLDPEVQGRCDTLLAEADGMFKAGRLKGAFDKYDEILKLVPVRTKMGGLASLQRAIIMDSFGYNDQAQALYKSLVIHPTPEVAKRAKRMLFGFDAAKFLKADTMDFSGKKQAWAKYFTQNSRVVYVQSEEEKARDAAASRQAAVLAVAVMLGPVAVFGFLALSK